jgi:UDP-N-acetyl-D-glucosamine/UDP-N-acetyl-D-galactosamine dehydrogenase
LADLYGTVVTAGIHRASSIKVAEAAKALENTQRDLNIALMNEMAIICDAMKIRTRDVLEAAGDQMEFSQILAGPGGRPLHRGRSLLSDLQGAGAGL